MIELGKKTLIIGERINPTGRQRLATELKAGNLEYVAEEARAQGDAGADIIDVNVGAPGINEAELLPRMALAVQEATGLPVCMDSSDPAALQAALKVAAEGSLVNSVTGDADVMDQLLPAVAEHNALVVAITKNHAGIPMGFEERMDMARRIVSRAASFGIGPERILVDFLTMPVASEPDSVSVTLRCIVAGITEMGVGTVLGASNISFGMPTRNIVNASFLSMCIRSGLSAAIVNPLEPGIVQTILAADMLCGRDPRGRRFLADYRARRREAY